MFHVKQYDSSWVDKLLHQVIQEAKTIGIPVSSRISPQVIINGRAKSRFGCCRRKNTLGGSEYTIEIGRQMMEAGEVAIRTILSHELIHTCRGCQNHGKLWKQYAREMEKGYGYRLSRTSSYEELGLKEESRERRYKYVVRCKSCGKEILRQRESALTRNPKHYRCRCGGGLECRPVDIENQTP